LSVRAVLLIGCVVLASCDQFARVGTLEQPSDDTIPPDQDAAAEDGGSDSGAQCPALAITVCDPVKNQGCSGALSMQCAIDYASTLTGYCIYSAPPAPGMLGECFNSGITESCPATFTCFGDRCEKICLCDADCEAGTCCRQPIEATGFSVCGDC
jgi:hypothetical protein